MSDRLTVGGLFSGIGGWELGLERAGMDIAWHCEADPFCRRVLERHWPGVPTFEDVQTLTAGMAEGVDVLCGGFPCQDISLAGKGAGIRGTRSGLWAEYARLIGEFEPRWVLVENVSALLGRGLSVVIADLSALGYDAEWDCIPASALGAHHQRDRLWIVAYPCEGRRGSRKRDVPSWESDARGRREIVADTDGSGPQGRSVCRGERPQVSGARDGRALADAHHERCDGRSESADAAGVARQAESLGSSQCSPWDGWTWAPEPDVGRVADGVPARVDRLHALGNALVPQIAEWIGRRIVAYEAEAVSDTLSVLRDSSRRR